MVHQNLDVIHNFPEELLAHHHWVLWKLIKKVNRKTGAIKWDKVPFQTNGEFAKTDDPATWMPHEDVAHAFSQGGYNGVGFVFSKDDPFVGIDIDDAYDANGTLKPRAREIISSMESFTERSQSGHGIHVIVKGAIPEAITKTVGHGVEMYDTGRFFALTGDTTPESQKEIAKRPIEIANLYHSFKPGLAAKDFEKPTLDDARELLRRLKAERCDDYGLWIRVGMALKATGDEYFQAFDEWSRGSAKYDSADCQKTWSGLKPHRIGYGSLVWDAREDSGDQSLGKKRRPINDDDDEDASEGKKETQAALLIKLADDADLFKDDHDEPFARMPVDGHFETAKVCTKNFRRWLAGRFWQTYGRAAGSQGMQDALAAIEARAVFDGPKRKTPVRLAEHDGAIWIDLCDPKWQAVRVDAMGWKVVERPPVCFRRPEAAQPLPMPVSGGKIDELFEIINIAPADRPLVLGWLVAAMRPRGPYIILALAGEHGSAKSTSASMLKRMVDPSKPDQRTLPRKERDLAIASMNSHCLAFDNVSGIPNWLSDGLCRLATGGGFATRQLFTDASEVLIESSSPMVLNGIENLGDRPDLLDRSILLNLPTIPENQRRTKEEVERRFEESKARIFGALLDAVSMAMRMHATTKIKDLPRMADFILWATAAEPALGLATGSIHEAYKTNRRQIQELSIDANILAGTLMDFTKDNPRWRGTARDLLRELERHDVDAAERQGWPRSYQALGGQLKRLVPNMRSKDVEIRFEREGGTGRRIINIERKGVSVVTNVTLSQSELAS